MQANIQKLINAHRLKLLSKEDIRKDGKKLVSSSSVLVSRKVAGGEFTRNLVRE